WLTRVSTGAPCWRANPVSSVGWNARSSPSAQNAAAMAKLRNTGIFEPQNTARAKPAMQFARRYPYSYSYPYTYTTGRTRIRPVVDGLACTRTCTSTCTGASATNHRARQGSWRSHTAETDGITPRLSCQHGGGGGSVSICVHLWFLLPH